MSNISKEPTKKTATSLTKKETTKSQKSNSPSPPSKEKDDSTVRVIIGEIGRDTDSGILGRGYSYNNGETFHVTDTIYGRVYDHRDGNAIWQTISHKVEKEVNAATAEIPGVVASANEAVKRADSAVANSKVNSDAIKAMQSAEAEAKAGADKALSDAQTAIKNVASDAEAIRQNVVNVEGKVTSAQAANNSQAKAMQADLDKAKQSISDTSENLDKVSANLDTYAKSAAEQGHDITELKKQQGSIEADLASANGNVTQLQATVKGLQGNLKDTDSNVASLSATASQAGVALKNAQSQVAQVIARADEFQATIAEQNKKIVNIKATADGASVAASNANSTATEAKVTASAASVIASNAKSDVLTVTTTASDAKVLATNANSQAMEANATANHVSINLSGVEKTATNAASQANVATSKANQAGSDANKAQTTANQANSNANKAQASADSNAKQLNDVANTVTTVQASVQATQKELSGKVDQATIDSTNKKLDDINAQVSVVAGEVRSKAEQTTVNGLSTNLNDLKSKTETTEKDGIDFNNCKSQMNIFSKNPKNAPNSSYWWYLRVEPGTDSRVTQYAVSDRDNHHYTRQFISPSWTPWKETADSNDVANLQAQVNKHSTEISNNTRQIQLKADSQTVDTINHTVQQQQAQQQVLADQIKTKVTSSDVKGILANGKYATQDYTQTLVNQTSRTLNANITEVKRSADNNHQADVSRMTNLQASIDGVQNTVKNKADMSQVTQLADTYQVKLSGTSLANLSSGDFKWTKGANNECINIADLDLSKIKKGTRLDLEFDYSADSDTDFLVQSDGEPWNPWGTNYAHATKGKTEHYSNIIVADDWSKAKAKHLAIRINKWKGTLHIANLTLTSGENVQTALNMLNNDVNLRVQKGDLISQINLEAGRALFQSKKIYMDADTVVMGPNTRAFIPSAAITSLDADKITTGYLRVPMSDGNGNTIQIGNGGIELFSNNKESPLFSNNSGVAKLNITAGGLTFGATTNGQYEILGSMSPILDITSPESAYESHVLGSETDINGIGYVVETQQEYGYPYGGDFFALSRSIKGPPSYYNGFMYNASGQGREIGSHFFDPIYIHPYGADNYIESGWVSWTNWDGGEKYPALVQHGINAGGIAFPKSGKVTIFDAGGHAYWPQPNQGTYNNWGFGSTYTF